MTPGTRPLRTAVGLDFGGYDVNQHAVTCDAAVFAATNLSAVATISR